MSLGDAVMTLGYEDVVDFIDWCMNNDAADVYGMGLLLYDLLTSDAGDT